MLEKENKWNKTNQWAEEIELLHNIIKKTSLIETTKWGGPVYTHKNKNVVGIGGFKSYFNSLFTIFSYLYLECLSRDDTI